MEQNMETILATLAEKIRELETQVSLRDYDIKNLNKDNERLKKENEELKAEIERYKKFSPVKFEKIERFGENDA